MDAIEHAAIVTVGRACGFAGFGILLLMAGLSFDPGLATRTGGVLCLAVVVILAVCALRAPHHPYKRTQLWTLLAKDKRPPAAVAQQIVGRVLRMTYVAFAKHAAGLAAILLVASVLLDLVF